MTMYAFVENGEVKSIGNIPRNFGTISAFDTIQDNAIYKTYGFLPYSFVAPEYDRWTEYMGGAVYTITEDSVTETREVLPIPEEQITERNNRYKADLTELLNKVLYKTDWTLLSDNGLTEAQSNAYQDLRDAARDAQGNLDNIVCSVLSERCGEISGHEVDLGRRLKDFSASMIALKDVIDGIGVNEE